MLVIIYVHYSFPLLAFILNTTGLLILISTAKNALIFPHSVDGKCQATYHLSLIGANCLEKINKGHPQSTEQFVNNWRDWHDIKGESKENKEQ